MRFSKMGGASSKKRSNPHFRPLDAMPVSQQVIEYIELMRSEVRIPLILVTTGDRNFLRWGSSGATVVKASIIAHAHPGSASCNQEENHHALQCITGECLLLRQQALRRAGPLRICCLRPPFENGDYPPGTARPINAFSSATDAISTSPHMLSPSQHALPNESLIRISSFPCRILLPWPPSAVSSRTTPSTVQGTHAPQDNRRPTRTARRSF